jgi:hypothetical protein
VAINIYSAAARATGKMREAASAMATKAASGLPLSGLCDRFQKNRSNSRWCMSGDAFRCTAGGILKQIQLFSRLLPLTELGVGEKQG